MSIDLHCHTTASDGVLSPEDLVARALTAEVKMLAITDHDTLDAYDALNTQLIQQQGLSLIVGIEFSTRWRHTGIHVLGLNLDPNHPQLQAGVSSHKQARITRLATIIDRLSKAGLPVDLQRVQQIAGDSQPGRPHVARHLVELGVVSDEHAAFDRYLGAGKVGDVKQVWCGLEEVVSWISAAGGVAVLAHPAHYKLTRTKLIELLTDFKVAGGRGMEVVSGHQDPEVTRQLARICRELGLLASCGSDFHRPGLSRELGGVALPADCEPVWSAWR